MLMLITGPTGKVGSNLIKRVLAAPALDRFRIRALCHNRSIPETDRLEVVRGSIADRKTAEAAMVGVTHVVHLATCKEIPETVMDVTVKGMFWLLEAFRASPASRQFLLVGGDAAIGHFFYRRPGPVDETTPHMAYPGCYALSKVLEEVMLAQYQIQYGINGCCLRAPWIMEKDDFRHTLSFGHDIFGGPDWKTMVPPDVAARCREHGIIPLLKDADGRPLKRNFVHVDDLVEAILLAVDHPAAKNQLFNICMDEPVDYGELARYLAETRQSKSIDIPSQFHSTWMDNTKAKFALDWRPRYDLAKLVESAWTYARTADDPRRVWYPG